MKTLAWVTLLLLAVSTAAETQTDISGIERAAAVYAATHFLKGSHQIALDPIPQLGMTAEAPRTQPEVTAIASALGATRVGPKTEFLSCPVQSPPRCTMRGADAVVILSRPIVEGDTASIGVVVHLKTDIAESPVFRRATTLILAKHGNSWVVVRRSGENMT